MYKTKLRGILLGNYAKRGTTKILKRRYRKGAHDATGLAFLVYFGNNNLWLLESAFQIGGFKRVPLTHKIDTKTTRKTRN